MLIVQSDLIDFKCLGWYHTFVKDTKDTSTTVFPVGQTHDNGGSLCGGQKASPGAKRTGVSALPLTRYVNLVMSPNFFGPQFLLFQQIFILFYIILFNTFGKISNTQKSTENTVTNTDVFVI